MGIIFLNGSSSPLMSRFLFLFFLCFSFYSLLIIIVVLFYNLKWWYMWWKNDKLLFVCFNINGNSGNIGDDVTQYDSFPVWCMDAPSFLQFNRHIDVLGSRTTEYLKRNLFNNQSSHQDFIKDTKTAISKKL